VFSPLAFYTIGQFKKYDITANESATNSKFWKQIMTANYS